MSDFNIYKSKGISLKNLGILNKVIAYSAGFIVPLAGCFGFIEKRFNTTITIPFLAVYLLSLLILIFISRYYTMALQKHGTFTISMKGLTKTINNLKQFYEFPLVDQIVIKKHLNSFFFPSNNDGSKSYLVTIIHNDKSKERLVVSSQSTDKPYINLIHSLKQLEKYKMRTPKIVK